MKILGPLPAQMVKFVKVLTLPMLSQAMKTDSVLLLLPVMSLPLQTLMTMVSLKEVTFH